MLLAVGAFGFCMSGISGYKRIIYSKTYDSSNFRVSQSIYCILFIDLLTLILGKNVGARGASNRNLEKYEMLIFITQFILPLFLWIAPKF